VNFDLLINQDMKPSTEYATIVHELAHLYCGHLGTPDPKWWPDRRGLSYVQQEFEAESVSYLICKRLGIDSPAEEYLSGCLTGSQDPPPISLECIMKASGLIEQMGKGRMKHRKQ
jgi:hypothetical protein